MARYNPFFEKAWMVRISAPEKRDLAYERVLERLEQLGFNLDLLSSYEHTRAVLEQLSASELEEVRQVALRYNVSDYFKKGMALKPREFPPNMLGCSPGDRTGFKTLLL